MKYFIFNPRLVSRYVLLLMIASILSQFIISDANAIPAFARKNNMPCSSCHSAWPMLNSFGHKYKENGYRFSSAEKPNKKITDNLSWDKNIPISAVFVARPYDKKNSGKAKNRAIHEIELMLGGPLSEKVSGFVEIEAEDEDTNARGFETGIPTAALTYTHSKALNVQASWTDLLWFDPYNTYTSGHRLTRGRAAVIDQAFGGADDGGKLQNSRQNLTLYGRPMNKLFYGVAYSGLADDSEGVDAATYTARIAYDVMPNLMIGGLFINGTCNQGATNCAVDRDFSRYAIDLEAQFNDWTITSVYLQAKDDDTTATAELENDAYYVQALYVHRVNGRAQWAPLVRIDNYEKNNGTENILETTFSLNYYFNENVRGMLELWDRQGEGATADDDRITLQLYASF